MCAMQIDGLLEIGSVTGTNVTISPGNNLIGRVLLEDGPNLNQAQIVNGELAVAGEGPSGGTSTSSGKTTIGTSAALIRAAVTPPTARKSISITNPSKKAADVLWISGSSGMTVGEGVPLYAGETYEDHDSQAAWYGIYENVTAPATDYDVPWLEITVP